MGHASTDPNNDGIAQDHEIGPSPSAGNFQLRSGATPGDLRRQYNWEYTLGVQHQVAPRLAVGALFSALTLQLARCNFEKVVDPKPEPFSLVFTVQPSNVEAGVPITFGSDAPKSAAYGD